MLSAPQSATQSATLAATQSATPVATPAAAPAATPGALRRDPLALPAPGAYALQRILRAPDGVVLDSDGTVHRLAEFTNGKVTLFSFIYTYCTDAKGCPLAYETLHALRKTLAADEAMRDRVRFVSMSFDPRYDTPPSMKSYGGQDARERSGPRWHFLTTRSGAELAPMLDGFGQDVSVAREQAPGQRVPTLSHMLKVYLIDGGGTVREIYSTSFLNQAVLLGDIKTLLIESDSRQHQARMAHTGLR